MEEEGTSDIKEMLFAIVTARDLSEKITSVLKGEPMMHCSYTLMFMLVLMCKQAGATVDDLCHDIRLVAKDIETVHELSARVEKAMNKEDA